MGMVPNPLALAAVKVIAYSAFGHQVEKRSEVRRSAWIFGAMRVFVGWMVGIPLLFLLPHEGESAGYLYYAILTVPRFLTWAILIYVWYRPIGGRRSTLLWGDRWDGSFRGHRRDLPGCGRSHSILPDGVVLTWLALSNRVIVSPTMLVITPSLLRGLSFVAAVTLAACASSRGSSRTEPAQVARDLRVPVRVEPPLTSEDAIGIANVTRGMLLPGEKLLTVEPVPCSNAACEGEIQAWAEVDVLPEGSCLADIIFLCKRSQGWIASRPTIPEYKNDDCPEPQREA